MYFCSVYTSQAHTFLAHTRFLVRQTAYRVVYVYTFLFCMHIGTRTHKFNSLTAKCLLWLFSICTYLNHVHIYDTCPYPMACIIYDFFSDFNIDF